MSNPLSLVEKEVVAVQGKEKGSNLIMVMEVHRRMLVVSS
jgi:hypothetical protein